jgi:MYXO-CTERM domain-containing protein
VTGSCSVAVGPRSDGTNALALFLLALVLGFLLRRRQRAAYRRWLK